VRKVLDGIEDPELASRYPKRTHLIPADNPKSGTMVTRALFGGDPAVLVYPDGREILFTPERASGLLAIVLLIGLAWTWIRSRRGRDADVIPGPKMRYSIFVGTGNLIHTFDDRDAAVAGLADMARSEPEAADDVVLVAQDDEGNSKS